MKKLALIALLPFAASAQQIGNQNCSAGLNECQFTDKVVYEIIDRNGVVVDRTTYERLVPLTYTEAMAHKYVRMLRHTEGGVKSFLDIITEGSATRVLGKQQR